MRADFLNLPVEATRPATPPDVNVAPTSPDRFFNRELSWLAFNWRVLEEVTNPTHPLMERLRFLSISANNLDEFYMVRVAGLVGLVKQGVKSRSLDGRTPAEQLHEIEADARRLMAAQQRLWLDLRAELRSEGVDLVDAQDLTDADRAAIEAHFLEQIFPVLTPLAIDPAHPFPFIPNKGFAMALQLRPKGGGDERMALIPIPAQVDRFVRLPAERDGLNLDAFDTLRAIDGGGPRPSSGPIPQAGGAPDDGGGPTRLRYCALETIIALFLDRLYPSYDVKGRALFRILRDSDIELEEEAEDLVEMFEDALKRRRRGDVVRLKIESGAPKKLARQLFRQLEASTQAVIEVDGLIGIADIDAMIDSAARPDLCWQPFTPRMPERVRDYSGDVFAAIREKDMLIHHPYESFSVVVKFLQQAAQDPDVISIRQTLYRTSKESPIVAALVEAAEAGKSVTALVELKARFDEAANIRLAKILERAGCQVVYGFVTLKTHAKMSTVVRREKDELITYSHFGTGNYHPITAKIYTDLSLFTCDPKLARDGVRIFNYVGSYAEPRDLEALYYAPTTMKPAIIERLEREAENARAGLPAQVWGKFNSVIEPDVIDALYRASQAGVRIDLIVRGICGLRPGVPGLSENIRVKSIVGRFLEHSRIVCFANGAALPSLNAEVYISSADWMDRNLNRRVETMAPIVNETVKRQILEQVMAANLADEAQSWVLQADGSYLRAATPDDAAAFNVHDFFMNSPSLSGRGERGADDAPRLRPRPALPHAPETGSSESAPARARLWESDRGAKPNKHERGGSKSERSARDETKSDAGKSDAGKSDVGKSDAGKSDGTKSDKKAKKKVNGWTAPAAPGGYDPEAFPSGTGGRESGGRGAG